jgi:peptidyl-tRNA hydrolase, PTH1 family
MVQAGAIRAIIGLGNPGPRYEQTRHNAGFWFIDALVRGFGGRLGKEPRFNGDIGRIAVDGRELRLFKPGAFVNRSGHALRSMTTFYRIELPSILVVHDDLDLPPGLVRIKRAGGHGGHNGLRDIFAHLGQDFWRLRLGVGHPGHKEQVVDYVLSKPDKQEHQAILEGIDEAIALLPRLVAGEFDKAMQQLHTNNFQ